MIAETRSKSVFVALAIALASLTGACGADRSAAYKKAFSAGERAQTAGRYDEAANAYLSAAGVANWDRDKEYARYLSALMKARAGDVKGAADMLDPIAHAKPPTPYSALATYKLAELRVEHGEEERGWKEMADVPVLFPEHGIGRVALNRVARHLHDESPAAALAWVESVKEKIGPPTAAGEAAYYERGKLLRELGRTKEARDQMIATADAWPYPGGSYFDDTLYAASELDEQLGDVPQAIADLERLLKEREVARFYGSYQRPKYAAALYRIGVLYADKLHDREKAREALHTLYTDHTTSPLRDDALWLEAKLYVDDGKKDKACDTLDTLAKNLIDSKFVPCAEAECPNLKRDSKSRAPKTCHETKSPE